jgi:transposase-like protein
MAGTIFQDTHLPLMTWFRAMWFVANQKYGTNAMGHRILGVSYTAAWNILHKLRRTMVKPGREALSGTVEVDETYIGGLSEGSPGRSADKKALVVIGVELLTKGLGRTRMKVIDAATSENLISFAKENIKPGSTVITDGWAAYSRLSSEGYVHEIGKTTPGQETLSHVHLVISLLKRWLLGTLQGAANKRHLEFYLDEYVFRFNRRKSRNRGLLFRRLLERAVETDPVTRDKLVSRDEEPSSQPGSHFDNNVK